MPHLYTIFFTDCPNSTLKMLDTAHKYGCVYCIWFSVGCVCGRCGGCVVSPIPSTSILHMIFSWVCGGCRGCVVPPIPSSIVICFIVGCGGCVVPPIPSSIVICFLVGCVVGVEGVWCPLSPAPPRPPGPAPGARPTSPTPSCRRGRRGWTVSSA